MGTGLYSFIGGGFSNLASGASSVVAGGDQNSATDLNATVVGGLNNIAGGSFSTVGGANNVAGGQGATAFGTQNIAAGSRAVALGFQNEASGDHSLAIGQRAKATSQGQFVWADATATDYVPAGINTFNVRANGGIRFYSSGDLSTGLELASGGTAWSTLSDRNAKKNFEPVDVVALLERLVGIPMEHWNYRSESDDATPHIGPMAQDFKAAFFPGRDTTRITTLEFDGVALAAIQGLNQKVERGTRSAEHEIKQLKSENAELKARLEKLEQLLTDKLNGGAQ
jgi:hypothetical protein